MLQKIKADICRYKKQNGGFSWEEPSLIVIILYRIGYSIRKIRFVPARIFLSILHVPFYAFFSVFFGIHIPRGTEIGPGLRIYHFGGIVLNSEVKIGSNCTLRHGVTIGNQKSIHDVPKIGNNVDIGAGAKILGDINIGDNVIVGANAVVISSVPDNCVAVGVPSRYFEQKKVAKDNE